MGQAQYKGRIGKALEILAASPTPMTCEALAVLLDATPRATSAVLWRCAHEKVPGFCRAEVDGQVLYAVGPGKLPDVAPPCIFVLPENLWAGWYNPATGITADKLGL